MKNISRMQMTITSMVIILPIIIGMIFWNRLPDVMATHFDANGVANGWSNKIITVFGIPLFLLLIHFICVYSIANDPKKHSVNKKVFNIIMWICPISSIFSSWLIYSEALGFEVNIAKVSTIFIALILIMVGNYLPKVRQNYTVGIKVPWTLDSEENWNKTHRLAGKLWMIGGGLSILSVYFIESSINITLVIITIIVIIPLVYSFALYKKNK